MVAQSAASTTAAARLIEQLADSYRMYADPTLLQQQRSGLHGTVGAHGPAEKATTSSSTGNSSSKGRCVIDPYLQLELTTKGAGFCSRHQLLAEGKRASAEARPTSSNGGSDGQGSRGSCNLVTVASAVLCFGSRGLLAAGSIGREEVEAGMRSGCLFLLVCPPALTLAMLLEERVEAVAAGHADGRDTDADCSGGTGNRSITNDAVQLSPEVRGTAPHMESYGVVWRH